MVYRCRKGIEEKLVETQKVDTEPEHRSNLRKPPVLVVLVGPPGTGKSHLARRVAAHVPIRIVETDEIRRRIARPPTYSREESGRVYQTAHRQIGRYLREGQNVAFDATNLYERGRQTLYRIAERNGARLLIVQTTAPEQVVEERLHRRKLGAEPLDRSEADWEVYCRMKGELEEIKRPHMIVDTSQDLKPAINKIVNFVLDESESSPDTQPSIGTT